MQCYKPLIRREDTYKWKTAKDGHKFHDFTVFSSDRLEDYLKNHPLGRYRYDQIPCGRCIGCRLDKSRDWANRGYLEASMYPDKNWFVTLTYDDKFLTTPESITTTNDITYTELDELEWKGTLVPAELKQFMKNFRQIMKREYNQDGIRFMACGEYGEEGRRPHYHLIIFNADLPSETFYAPHVNFQKNTSWKNTIIERAWGRDDKKHKEAKGICDISEANWNNIAYTARYITKKQYGKEAEDFYAAQGEEIEFFRTSNGGGIKDPKNNPGGIGKPYYDLHKEEIYKIDKILIRNKKGSHWVTPPKYFDDLYERECPEAFEEIKKRRRKKAAEQALMKAETTSLTMWEQLQIEQATKEDAALALKRNLV